MLTCESTIKRDKSNLTENESANFLQQIWTYLQFCKVQSRLLQGSFPILFEEKV